MGGPNGGNFRGGRGFLFDFFSRGLQAKSVVTINTENSRYFFYSAVKSYFLLGNPIIDQFEHFLW